MQDDGGDWSWNRPWLTAGILLSVAGIGLTVPGWGEDDPTRLTQTLGLIGLVMFAIGGSLLGFANLFWRLAIKPGGNQNVRGRGFVRPGLDKRKPPRR